MAHNIIRIVVVVVGLITSLGAQNSMPVGPTCVKPSSGKGCLPLAPTNTRIDLIKPSFSNPTSITNALHPSSTISQVIYGGQVDGKPWRTEFTALAIDKTIEWDGTPIKVVSWQYLAFSGGRIDEVAIDWFAQADDGAVWYFGEDVFNYVDGVVADTDGTWIAGKNRPPGMIMPGHPKVGDAYRPENIPESVFEEVIVKKINQTVAGPSGPIAGALIVSELHLDGKSEEKVFAPGYGEFSTGSATGDFEQASFVVPADARTRSLPAAPAALVNLSSAVRHTFDALGKSDWSGAAAAVTALKPTWASYRAGRVPETLARQMSRDIAAIDTAVTSRKSADARHAALRIAQNDLDLRLQHEPLLTIERARVELWVRQTLVDAAAKDVGSVLGDVTTLEWTWRRIRGTINREVAARIDAQLKDLRQAADAKDLAVVAKTGSALLATLAAQ